MPVSIDPLNAYQFKEEERLLVPYTLAQIQERKSSTDPATHLLNETFILKV